ncbi:M48 family metallopeptidase [Ferrimonas pelagia]|uniref:Peptidase M48 domain-containing protein n=1 Tax=Ferrimonas pelagia TaxID=1177826 RepID=A0ABP9EDJ7_9GAMM
MARFENRLPPENNVSPQHPLMEFSSLLAAVVVLVAVITAMLALGMHRLADQIPLEWEQSMAQAWSDDLRQASPAQTALDGLLDDLVRADPLPEGMTARATLIESEQINAFAGLGGEIIVHTGLVDAMRSENGLALVLAHELAHVRERHALRQASRHLGIALVGAFLLGESANMAELAIATTELGFSREQEMDADQRALENVVRLYGHLGGTDVVFSLLGDDVFLSDWFSTHPDLARRQRSVDAAIEQYGEGGETPLRPQWFERARPTSLAP